MSRTLSMNCGSGESLNASVWCGFSPNARQMRLIALWLIPAATGMSQSAISRIWRAFGLKPHQTEAFKLSPDPQFIDKVRDIVALYLNPPEAAVVLCVDEKAQIQALDRSAPVLPLMPGVPERRSHD